MCEIKYRVWSKKQKTYNYKHPFNTHGCFYISQNGVLFSDYGNVITPEIKQDYFVIERYTGIKDQDDKEIYEGDILRWKHYYEITGEDIETTAKVYWEEKDASFVVGDWFESLGHLVDEDKVEVVGNIHENPELLNGDKPNEKE